MHSIGTITRLKLPKKEKKEDISTRLIKSFVNDLSFHKGATVWFSDYLPCLPWVFKKNFVGQSLETAASRFEFRVVFLLDWLPTKTKQETTNVCLYKPLLIVFCPVCHEYLKNFVGQSLDTTTSRFEFRVVFLLDWLPTKTKQETTNVCRYKPLLIVFLKEL